MSISRIIEFIAGIATTLISIVLYSYSVIRDVETHRQNEAIQISVTGFLGVFAVLVAPAISVGIGSYAHSIKHQLWGFWFLFMGAVVNNLLIVMFFVAIVWAFPSWAVLLFIIEFFLALIAVVAALCRGRNPTNTCSGLAGSGLLW